MENREIEQVRPPIPVRSAARLCDDLRLDPMRNGALAPGYTRVSFHM
jgi:hypothetical protein